MHVLSQKSAAARFYLHRDTEENKEGREVSYSFVILLERKGHLRVPDLVVAGAAQAAEYGTRQGHIFRSDLYHATSEGEADCIKLGVFVGVGDQ